MDSVEELAAAIFVWIAVFLVGLFLVTMGQAKDSGQIQAACDDRGGVAQIIDSTFKPMIEGSLTVVCKNGNVRKVK